ncbi:hypothetical protein MTYM_02022 [Methylococcales bacterium]|nr:hypothetical protein MTYM_02022 [Methylococcales bacterium]
MATPSSLLRLSFDHIESTDKRLLSGYSADELGHILGEQLLIARYKSGDFSLGEVSEMLGFYPDIARTRQWLNDRGIIQDYSATERAHLDQSLRELCAGLGISPNT